MEKREKLMKIFEETDMEFYEKYLSNLTEEEFARFLEENPDFLKE